MVEINTNGKVRMRRAISVITWLFIVSMFFAILYSNRHYSNNLIQNETGTEFKRSSSPISIDGNAQIATIASVGNGSISNPYIIEDYYINASNLGVDGIFIQNTNAYFILRNCTILYADAGWAGIRLQNVTHGNITACNLQFNSEGVELYSAKNNTFTGINATRNGVGFSLSSSSENEFSHNLLINSSYRGFDLSYSNNNSLINNTVIHGWEGIEIRMSSKDNVIINNTLEYNADGVELYKAGINRFYGNSFRGCGFLIMGETFSHYIQEITPNNTIDDRLIYYYKGQRGITVPNNGAQVILVNCSEMVVSEFNLSIVGISLCYTDNSTVYNNNITTIRWHGIKLVASMNNTIENNTVIGNNTQFQGINCLNYGISLWKSNNNTISHNIAHYNKNYGIYLLDSNNNTLINNSIKYNERSGICLEGSDYNRVLNNTSCFNDVGGEATIIAGIFSWDSHHNTFSFNTLNNNEDYGIYLRNSTNNQIRWNTLHWNWECIYEDEFCFNNIIENNDCIIPPRPLPFCFWLLLFTFPLYGTVLVIVLKVDIKDKAKHMHPTIKDNSIEEEEIFKLKKRLKFYKIGFILGFFSISVTFNFLNFLELFEAIPILEYILFIALPASIMIVIYLVAQVRLNRQFKKVFNEKRKLSPYWLAMLFAVTLIPFNLSMCPISFALFVWSFSIVSVILVICSIFFLRSYYPDL